MSGRVAKHLRRTADTMEVRGTLEWETAYSRLKALYRAHIIKFV